MCEQEHEHEHELTPELTADLQRLADGLPIEELTSLSKSELVELLIKRTRLGSLVRDQMSLWLDDDDGGRADELRAYIAAGQDVRDALTVHQRAMSRCLAVGEKRDLGNGFYIERVS